MDNHNPKYDLNLEETAVSREYNPEKNTTTWKFSNGSVMRVKGKPVQFNMERQSCLTMNWTENTNEMYFTDVRLAKWRVCKGQYLPAGDTFVYPTKWGKKRAVKEYIHWYYEDTKKTITLLSRRLSNFDRILSEVEEWPDGVLDPTIVKPTSV